MICGGYRHSPDVSGEDFKKIYAHELMHLKFTAVLFLGFVALGSIRRLKATNACLIKRVITGAIP